jgi:hypothetical protein
MGDTIPTGYTITYTHDTAIGDGWWADLRDELGRVRESGGGHTQEAARAHLLERVARDPLADIDRMPAPVLYSLEAMITALTAVGYEVTFGHGNEGQPEAFIVKDNDTCLAHGDTHAEALRATLPEAVERYLAAMIPLRGAR